MLLLAAFAACEQASPPEPTEPALPPQAVVNPALEPGEVVKAYYRHLWAGELAQAYELVSAGDRTALPFEDFERRQGASTVLRLPRKQLRVIETQRQGAVAVVTVETDVPDLNALNRKIVVEAQSSGGQMPPPAELIARVTELAEAPDAPMVTTRMWIHLLEDDGAWRLDFEWDGPQDGRRVPEKIRKLREPDAGPSEQKP